MHKKLQTIFNIGKMSINTTVSNVFKLLRIQHNDFSVFQNKEALDMNKARLDHLATLNLDLTGKSVLEVGAGVGFLTNFFEVRGCNVLSTDSRKGNVMEIKRRHPQRNVRVLNLEKESDFKNLGVYDIVFCYGTLYHVKDPEKALRLLSVACREIIIIETGVTSGNQIHINQITERGNVANQASSWTGCRPTRPYVMNMLKKYFGYAYVSKHQPDHPDFELHWDIAKEGRLLRAIFVGSKKPLNNVKLLDYLPNTQTIDTGK